MNSTADFKRKTRSLIAKNLIIMLVLAAVSVLAIWSWFIVRRHAEASGMSVKAVSDGVEISWDNKDFYKNLTATDSLSVTNNTGMCKYITGSSQTAQRTKLITGNGINFFEPYLNRRTGTVFTKNGAWQGSVINDTLANGENKFVDIDIYFRSSKGKTIYLAGDSKVNPSSDTERISQYGFFSTDYIAGASRVAFLNEVNGSNSTNFIWAPNSDYYLEKSESGYTQITDVEPLVEKGSNSNSNATKVPEQMLTYKDNVTYYIWFPNKFETDADMQNSNYTAYPMTFKQLSDDGRGLYVFEHDITYPTNRGTDGDIYYFITTTLDRSKLTHDDYHNSVNISNSYNLTKDTLDSAQNGPKDYNNPYVRLSDQVFNFNDSKYGTVCGPKLTFSNLHGTPVSYTIGYNPHTKTGADANYSKTTIVLGYTGGGKIYDRTGVSGDGSADIYYYDMAAYCGVNTPILLANDTYVLTSDNTDYYEEAVFADDAKTRIASDNVKNGMKFKMFKVGTGASAKYYFYNVVGDRPIVVNDDGSARLANVGEPETPFYWGYKDGFKSPVLQVADKDQFLVISGGQLKVVSEANAKVEELITPLIGSSYNFYSGSSVIETYKYYDSVNNKELSFTKGQSGTNYYFTMDSGKVKDMLFTSASYHNESSLPIIGHTGGSTYTPVVRLTRNPTTGYYTGKVTVRVWTEGTDREAKIPLAGGKYNLSLHFTSATPK